MLYKEKILAGQNGFSNFHNTEKEAGVATRPLLLNKWGTELLLRGILLLIFKCLQLMIKVNFFSIHNAHAMMYYIHLNTYFNYNYPYGSICNYVPIVDSVHDSDNRCLL